MSSDALLNLDGVEQKVRLLRDRKAHLTTLRDKLRNDLSVKEQEVVLLTKKVEMLTLVSELFRRLMDSLVDKQVKSVEKVATNGLQTIFPDLDLSLESEVGPKYNKISVEFFLRRGKGPTSHRGRPLEAFGGGPSSVISLILRVLTIKKLGLYPLILLDESLNAVSDEYIDLTSQFLKSLAAKMGFDILLVTHKAAFSEHSAITYRCQELTDGVTTNLALKKI